MAANDHPPSSPGQPLSQRLLEDPGLPLWWNDLPDAISTTDMTSQSAPYGDLDQSSSSHVVSGHEQPIALASEAAPATPPIRSGRGSRFSSEAVKTLRAWWSAHLDSPYPTPHDFNNLSTQTGLNRSQLAMWFANARRRAKPDDSASGGPGSFHRRQPSPAPRPIIASITSRYDQGVMDPMQRWRSSPPEHEPADPDDISRALRAAMRSPDHPGPVVRTPSRQASSAGSVVTSDSNTSAESAYSHTSARSGLSLDRRRRKRDRRAGRTGHPDTPDAKCCAPRATAAARGTLKPAPDLYQCTFCTQTFKTKHNWQRHEKSFHLSLEAWECSPGGPTFVNNELLTACAYCGHTDPDEAHLNSHNYKTCSHRSAAERTFFRKDHLGQHLRLIHHTTYMPDLMQAWRSETVNVRSRCGFCGLAMQSWSERVAHLAQHFKQKHTMAGWKGDWGFDTDILGMVENAMPPYLINFERNSPFPFTARHHAPWGPSGVYELLRAEIEDFAFHYQDTHHRAPTTLEMQAEACSIVFAAELLWSEANHHPQSWVHDLLTSSEAMTNQAKGSSIQESIKFRYTDLSLPGKCGIFDDCNMEHALKDRVMQMVPNGPLIQDQWLQEQAEDIIKKMEMTTVSGTGVFAPFLVELIFQSTGWLAPFRARTGIGNPPAPDLATPAMMDTDPGLTETLLSTFPEDPTTMPQLSSFPLVENDPAFHATASDPDPSGANATLFQPAAQNVNPNPSMVFLDYSNYYRGLIRDLSRFVSSTTSVRNPTRRIPTDEELQCQARWILYDDDDPWNQTPADNPDWLAQFKRSVGLEVEQQNSAGLSLDQGLSFD